MLCASIGANAQIDIWARTQNGIEGVGIYGWKNPGDVAALLNGTYSGQVNGNKTIDEAKAAAFVKLGSTNEEVNQADIEALSAFTNVQYLRMDNCTISGDIDFSKIGVGSSSLLEVTLPATSTREQVVAANTTLKATASGLKLVVGMTGEVVTDEVKHYWYTLPGSSTQIEYTDPVSEGQTSVHVDNYAVMAGLTLEEGYPKSTFVNSKFNNEVTETSDEDTYGSRWDNNVEFKTVTPAKLKVVLTSATGWTDGNGQYFGTTEWWISNDGKVQYGGGGSYGLSDGTQLTSAEYYTYQFKNNYNETTLTYTGTVYTDDNGVKYGIVDNIDKSNGYAAYTYDVSTSYKYTYVDKNGNTQTLTQSTADEDGKIQIDTYTGDLTLTTTTETSSHLETDGATAFVNVAGSLSDAGKLFTNANGDYTLDAYRSAKNLYVHGEVNKTDIADFSNFTQRKLVDISEGTFTEDGAGAAIVSAFSSLAAAAKPVVIIPTPEYSTDPITGSADEVALQGGSITYAYYVDEAKTKMNAWCPKAALVLQNLEPVVNTSMTLTFLPDYKNDGTFSQYMLMYVNDASGDGGNLNSAEVLGQLPFGSIDLTWVYYGAPFCDYSNINENTHYVIVPTNSTSTEYDFTDESGEKDFKYSDNIWVAATYKGKAEPYATKVYYDGREFISNAYASNNQTGFGAEGTTANITYIRKAGTLSGAASLVSDLQKNAERTVIVGKVASDDITAINIMRNSVLDLSGAVLQDGADLSTLKNEYIQYLALPYNSEEDVASFKASQCKGLLGVGKYDNVNKHLYLQSYQEGGMYIIMSCLAKANDIEYVTAAGEMNARDISASSGCFDENGHLTLNYKENGLVNGVTGTTVTVMNDESNENQPKINGATIPGALSGKIASYDKANNKGFKGLDFTGLTLKKYESEPDNGIAKIYSYDNTYQDDLDFAYFGYVAAQTNGLLEYIKLPVDKSVWRIPTQSYADNIIKLKEFVIPSQYREIGSFAFVNDNDIFRVCTTSVNGNGEVVPYEEFEGSLTGQTGGNTITLPPSLVKLEAGAFGNVEHFTDVYVTSDAVPVCEMDAFGAGTYYGWGGFDDKHDGMAQRTDYGTQSSSTSKKAFGVLHWTANYSLAEVKKLTDVERVYSLRDREGKNDDRGNILSWPTQSEIYRAYALARTGYLDGAWKPYSDGDEPSYDTNGTLTNVYSAEGSSITQEQGNAHYADFGSPAGETYTDYIGWHQFVLVGSWSYAEKYEYRPWNSICLPYDVSWDNMLDMYAVTKSVSANNKKIIVDAEGYPLAGSGLDGVDATTGEVATDAETLLPTISTLTSVKRHISYVKDAKGEYVLNEKTGHYEHKKAEELKNIASDKRYKTDGGKITLQFTEGMVKKSAEDEKVYNWQINSDYQWSAESASSQTGDYVENTDKVIMKAGYPYLQKVFVPLGTDNVKTYAINKLKAAKVEIGATEPYDGWVVPTVGNSGGDDLDYKFKGYFDVSEDAPATPMYCYFIWTPKSGESLWYRYDQSWGEAWGQTNRAASYSAIIGLIGENNTWPEYDLMLTDKNSGAQAKAVFGISFEEEGTETTAIRDVLESNDMFGETSGRVYNMNGQVVNENGSLKGLGKGLYILNGKKYIVK